MASLVKFISFALTWIQLFQRELCILIYYVYVEGVKLGRDNMGTSSEERFDK
jgi:hypothetical protein